MSVVGFAFYLFALCTVTGGLFTVVSRNPVHSVLWLILTFLSSAGLFVLLGAEFVAMLLVIVYVGAVAVLFLFVVMMLDVKILETSKDLFKYIPIGSIIGGLFLIEMSSIIYSHFKTNSYNSNSGKVFMNDFLNYYDRIDVFSDIEALGQLLYTHYIVQFLVAGFILLLAVIGAVVLTMNNNMQNTKNQMFFKQISRDYKNILLF